MITDERHLWSAVIAQTVKDARDEVPIPDIPQLR